MVQIRSEDVQCPACKSHKTEAVDSKLRRCHECKAVFARRLKEEQAAAITAEPADGDNS